jgi:hypothetical protein
MYCATAFLSCRASCKYSSSSPPLLLPPLQASAAYPDEVVQAAIGCILHEDVQLLILVCMSSKEAVAIAGQQAITE